MITIRHTWLRLYLEYAVFSRGAVAVFLICCGLIAISLSTGSLAAQLEPQNMLAKEEYVAECTVADRENTRQLVDNKLQADPIEEKRIAAGDQMFFVSFDIYEGWRAYQTFCRACHAINASGQKEESPLTIGAKRSAPSLQEAVWCKKNFQDKIKSGGGGMPSWRNNLLVSTRLDQIHLYVAVVTLGKLPPPEDDERMLRVKPAPGEKQALSNAFRIKPPGRPCCMEITRIGSWVPASYFSGNPDGLRASKVEHPVEGGRSDGDLGRLGFVGARSKGVAEHTFVSAD